MVPPNGAQGSIDLENIILEWLALIELPLYKMTEE